MTIELVRRLREPPAPFSIMSPNEIRDRLEAADTIEYLRGALQAMAEGRWSVVGYTLGDVGFFAKRVLEGTAHL